MASEHLFMFSAHCLGPLPKDETKRLTGRVISWKDDKGYGFIRQMTMDGLDQEEAIYVKVALGWSARFHNACDILGFESTRGVLWARPFIIQ